MLNYAIICQIYTYLSGANQLKTHKMTQSQINRELESTKKVMNKLMDCIKKGQMEFYSDYLKTSSYYLKLSKFKPMHNLKTV